MSIVYLTFPGHRSACTKQGFTDRPSDSSGRKYRGSTSLNQAFFSDFSLSSCGPRARSSVSKASFMTLVQNASHDDSHLLFCNKFPYAVLAWNPNFPVGDLSFVRECRATTAAMYSSGPGTISSIISTNSVRKKWTSLSDSYVPKPTGRGVNSGIMLFIAVSDAQTACIKSRPDWPVDSCIPLVTQSVECAMPF